MNRLKAGFFGYFGLMVTVALVLAGCERFDPEAVGGELGEFEGEPALILDNGDVYPVVPDAFSGAIGHVSISEGLVFIPGWAVNTREERGASLVVAVSDGRIVASTAPDVNRDSAAQRWGGAVNPAGFRVEVPYSVLAGAEEHPQFFALYGDEKKIAGELPYRGRSRCMLEQLPADPAECEQD